MFKLDDIGSLYYSLPPNMQDAYNHAFTVAVDKQIKKLLGISQKLMLWVDLDNADPKYYDYMAKSLGIPYYKSEYEDLMKLDLIKKAILTRAQAGTFGGVTDYLSTIFDSFMLIPWYEYNGKPYHFKIRAAGERTPDIDKQFNDTLKKIKAARSVFDTIETVRTIDEETYMGARYTGVIIAPEITPYEED